MSYSIHNDENEVQKALALTRGSYQRDLIMGREALSGATLKGKAKSYGGKYADSRRNLLARLTTNGVIWMEDIGPHNKRLLVIG